MKVTSIAVAVGLFLNLAALTDNGYAFFAGTIQITETGENDLIIAGSPFDPIITGMADNWTITYFPPLVFFADIDVFVGEPGDPLHVNHIVAAGPVLNWQSDIENPSGIRFPNRVKISPGASAIGHQSFDLILAEASVPDSGTTVLLLAMD